MKGVVVSCGKWHEGRVKVSRHQVEMRLHKTGALTAFSSRLNNPCRLRFKRKQFILKDQVTIFTTFNTTDHSCIAEHIHWFNVNITALRSVFGQLVYPTWAHLFKQAYITLRSTPLSTVKCDFWLNWFQNLLLFLPLHNVFLQNLNKARMIHILHSSNHRHKHNNVPKWRRLVFYTVQHFSGVTRNATPWCIAFNLHSIGHLSLSCVC